MLKTTVASEDSDDAQNSEIERFRGLIRYERQIPVSQVSYYLCGDIRDSHYYTELFYTLRTASATDLIYIHLNSSGGDFNTGLQIMNNICASDAHVVTVLEARAYSMAALIFLTGDEWVVHDNCQLMFHTYSGIFSGKGNEQQAEGIAVSKWFEKVMQRICMPFLSEAEIGRILRGSDVWMDSDEIHRRVMRMQRTKKSGKSSIKKKALAKAPPAALPKQE